MANRHGDYRSDYRRDPGREQGSRREGSDEERDSPEVTGFGRNVSADYRRQSNDWGAEQDDRGSRRWSEGADALSGYDDGRVMYGQRGGAQRGREYGGSDRDRTSNDWDRSNPRHGYGRGWQGAQQGYGEGEFSDRGYGYGGYGQSGGAQSSRSQGQDRYGQRSYGNYGAASEFGMGGSQLGQYRGSGGQPSRGQSFRGKGPKGYTRTDERLKEIICEMLTEDQDIDASDIEIRVVSGEVTLDGSVEDRYIKYQVEELIGNVVGVKDVRNQLRVSGGRQRGQSDAQRSYESGSSGVADRTSQSVGEEKSSGRKN